MEAQPMQASQDYRSNTQPISSEFHLKSKIRQKAFVIWRFNKRTLLHIYIRAVFLMSILE